MKKSNKILFTAAICFSFYTPAFAGGIPVIDAASLAQQIQQVAAWAQQYQQMTQQIQQLQQQIASTTGSRGFSSALNSPAFQQARRMLPQDAQTLLDLAANGSYGNLANSINTIKQATTTLNNGSFSSAHASDQWAADLNRAASNKALSMEAYNSAQQRLSNLESLMSQISTTEDPKAIGELQARIATEQGLIQNEQAKIQAMTMLVAAEKQIAEIQARETSIKMGGSVASIPRTQVQP
jgi:type IV secretion system protein VirB5